MIFHSAEYFLLYFTQIFPFYAPPPSPFQPHFPAPSRGAALPPHAIHLAECGPDV